MTAIVKSYIVFFVLKLLQKRKGLFLIDHLKKTKYKPDNKVVAIAYKALLWMGVNTVLEDGSHAR